MERVYNFSAGPAVLPERVLHNASSEMLNYRDSGMSVMEMSHRSSHFQSIIDEAEADLRKLMNIPNDYRVLFLQGGATLQFSMIPLNLMPHKKADYVITGTWAKKACEEAQRFGDAQAIASSADKNFASLPSLEDISACGHVDADYLYICQNNTIYGTRYPELPKPLGAEQVLVSDVSSMFLSEELEVRNYGLIFGGVQKNIGPAGLSIAIIREDLIPTTDLHDVPLYLQYKTHADAGSLYNTPNCWAIYICGLVFKDLLGQGGISVIAKKNYDKAQILYDFLDESKLFSTTVSEPYRSRMNVCFVTGDPDCDARFIAYAQSLGLVNLKGHRSVGGMRASLYNALPKAAVEALVDALYSFEKEERHA